MKHDFGNRAVAFIIDSIIVGIASSILQAFINIGSGSGSFIGINVELGTNDLLTIVVYIVYFVYFASAQDGMTLGKQAMRVEIRFTDGTKMPSKKLVQRELLKAVLMPISIISLILVIFRDDNKSIHDIVMDTLVYTSDSLDQTEEDIFDKMESDDIFDDYYK